MARTKQTARKSEHRPNPGVARLPGPPLTAAGKVPPPLEKQTIRTIRRFQQSTDGLIEPSSFVAFIKKHEVVRTVHKDVARLLFLMDASAKRRLAEADQALQQREGEPPRISASTIDILQLPRWAVGIVLPPRLPQLGGRLLVRGDVSC